MYEVLVRNTDIVKYITNRIMPNFVIKYRVIDDNKFLCSDILLGLLETPEVVED